MKRLRLQGAPAELVSHLPVIAEGDTSASTNGKSRGAEQVFLLETVGDDPVQIYDKVLALQSCRRLSKLFYESSRAHRAEKVAGPPLEVRDSMP
jgi:hypothetical protein